MSPADSARRGRELLAERVGQASGFVEQVPNVLDALKDRRLDLPRLLVTTGIGTSEGHARHLAEAAVRWLGQPARFASTGSLARNTPPYSKRDWLVVFSQGLSANARHALRRIEEWGGVILVTGLSRDSASEDAGSEEKRTWLEDLARRGVIQIELGCGLEYGTLLRVIGARVGYAVAWSLLRTLAWRRLESCEALHCDRDKLRVAQDEARLEVARVFPGNERIAPFFSGQRSLVLVAEGGMLELAEQLSLKLAEGMLRPQPRCVDVLHFAHGPFQSLARRPTSIVYLSQTEPDREAADWLARLGETLDPELHDLRVLCASLPLPFSVLEYEAMFDECVLRVLAETELDLVDWPGADREAPLYARGPELEESREVPKLGSAPGTVVLEDAVWPEVERAISCGRDTALIALGSIEQHGPHLPLGTDRFIADALAKGLAQRLQDAFALPALAIGCASEHLDFSGTLHIEPATLEALLRDLLASLEGHGFRRAFVFTAHGGNIDALVGMRPRLEAGLVTLELRIETDLPVSVMQARSVEAESLMAASAGPHAGEYETSVVAMLAPGSIRREGLGPGRMITPEESQDLFYPSLRPNTETGVLGDPSSASADRGQRYLEAWLDLLETTYLGAFARGREKNRQ
ncbi:MAG: creatininase family protein [Myxococcales bacterium]